MKYNSSRRITDMKLREKMGWTLLDFDVKGKRQKRPTHAARHNSTRPHVVCGIANAIMVTL